MAVLVAVLLAVVLPMVVRPAALVFLGLAIMVETPLLPTMVALAVVALGQLAQIKSER
jgi:hypothetical protein